MVRRNKEPPELWIGSFSGTGKTKMYLLKKRYVSFSPSLSHCVFPVACCTPHPKGKVALPVLSSVHSGDKLINRFDPVVADRRLSCT
jgi:hypothetical protein